MPPVAAQPSFRRQHEIGSPSARSVLLTVLGEFLLPAESGARPARAWTSAFIETLGLVGIEEKAARQALARTAADGWITAVRQGRRAAWTLTAAGRQLLSEGAQRIYSFGAAALEWDGQWLLVLASVPETDRRRRHLLRSRLGWAGFGSPSPGLWVSPYPDRQAEVLAILVQADVAGSASSFVARRGLIGDPVQMVRQAWDVDAIDARYEAFVDLFDALSAHSGTAALRAQIQLVHEWRRFPLVDPALPIALLPDGWSGQRAAALFHDRHAQWSTAARSAWANLAT